MQNTGPSPVEDSETCLVSKENASNEREARYYRQGSEQGVWVENGVWAAHGLEFTHGKASPQYLSGLGTGEHQDQVVLK